MYSGWQGVTVCVSHNLGATVNRFGDSFCMIAQTIHKNTKFNSPDQLPTFQSLLSLVSKSPSWRFLFWSSEIIRHPSSKPVHNSRTISFDLASPALGQGRPDPRTREWVTRPLRMHAKIMSLKCLLPKTKGSAINRGRLSNANRQEYRREVKKALFRLVTFPHRWGMGGGITFRRQ